MPVGAEGSIIPGHQAFIEKTAQVFSVNPTQAPDKLLLKQRREKHFPVEKITEGIAVCCQQAVREGSAATGMTNYENGPLDFLPPQPGEQYVVQDKTASVEQVLQRHQQQEPDQRARSPGPVLQRPHMAKYPPVIFQIKIQLCVLSNDTQDSLGRQQHRHVLEPVDAI